MGETGRVNQNVHQIKKRIPEKCFPTLSIGIEEGIPLTL